MYEKQNELINALVGISAAIPAAARKELSSEFTMLLDACGLNAKSHGYLWGKLPRLNSGRRVSKSVRLDAKNFTFELHNDEFAHSSVASGHASLAELAAFCGKSPRMLENYMRDERKQSGGRTIIPHHKTIGHGFISYVHDPQAHLLNPGAATLDEALAIAKQKDPRRSVRVRTIPR